MRWPALLPLVVASLGAADEMRLLMPAALAARVVTGDHGGQTVTIIPFGERARVCVSRDVRPLLAPTIAEVRKEAGAAGTLDLEVPGDFVLPYELRRAEPSDESSYSLLVRVVSYVSRRITLDERDRGPQDAIAVLARGRGRCSGRANLAVGLLRVLGVPARVVHGISVGEHEATWHRWGEAWLGKAGWVAFDPGASVGVVSVRYLRMNGAAWGVSLSALRVLGVREQGYFGLPRQGVLRTVPAGGLTVRCEGGGEGLLRAVALRLPDGSWLAREGRGPLVFSGLLPGRYLLVWRARDVEHRRSLVLGSSALVTVDIGGGERMGL